MSEVRAAARLRRITLANALDFAAAVRPAARGGVHVAQRGCGGHRVAAWAGHSVAVLLRVYAKCLDGGELAARAKVEQALTG